MTFPQPLVLHLKLFLLLSLFAESTLSNSKISVRVRIYLDWSRLGCASLEKTIHIIARRVSVEQTQTCLIETSGWKMSKEMFMKMEAMMK